MYVKYRYKTSMKVRIWSVVLAFAVLIVGLPSFGAELGLSADAVAIHSSDDSQSSYKDRMNSKTRGIFTYTGEFTKKNKVTLFDYVSDYEIDNNSYNNVSQKEEGYVDSYTQFNSAISNEGTSGTISAAANNITLAFSSSDVQSTDSVYVHLWNDTNHEGTKWPGIQMDYDSSLGKFVYTFSPDKRGAQKGLLGFTPEKVIFNDGSGQWQTSNYTFPETLEKGKTYHFNKNKPHNQVKIYLDITGGASSSTMNIYLWDSDGNNGGWPPTTAMSRVGDSYTQFYHNTSETRWKSLLFYKSNKGWQSADKNGQTFQLGHTYSYSVNVTDTSWGTSSQPVTGPTDVETYKKTTGSRDITGIICKYTMPLYFGCFWRDNNVLYTDSSHPGYLQSNKAIYNGDENLSYNNFWWQANMGLKSINTLTGDDNAGVRGHASAQGLVNTSLSTPSGAENNYRGDLMQAGDNTELPYFNKSWADTGSNSTYMKYYNKDGTEGDISFPFYEVVTTVDSNKLGSGKTILGSYAANPAGDSTQQYARFYQFNANDSNLKFVYDNDLTQHSGHFEETNVDIYKGDLAGDRSNVGYFPFNTTNSQNGSINNHNLGFGTKFEMDFKLQADGQVGVTNSEGDDLDHEKFTSKVDTIFEFEGDDDLWVFIDGNLVLDMGGAHNKSHGIINFAQGTATVDKAIRMNDGSGKDDLGAAIRTPSTTPVEDSTVLNFKDPSAANYRSVLAGGSFNGSDYVTTKTHTITIFYMERGMLDSNLLIRFNYSPEANFSRMKIAEATNFDNINEGLKNLTRKAAEDDVFKYTVSNKGTISDDVKVNTAKYPTAAQSIRTSEYGSLTTQLTPGSTVTPAARLFQPSGNNSVFDYVKNTSYLWVDGIANNQKMVGLTTNSGGSDEGGDLWLMYGTCSDLYPTTGSAQGFESSAEFEKQFTKGSIMKILQDDSLYKPKRKDGSNDVVPGLFNNSSGNQLQSSGRSVSNYYETNVVIRDRQHNTVPRQNDGTFEFRNITASGEGITPVDPTATVMLTEYFTNTPKTGAITITKSMTSGQTDTSEFTLKLRLDDIFGVTSVDADTATDYTGLEANRVSSDSSRNGAIMIGSDTVTIGSETKTCGTFGLKPGETVTITGIPVGTKYKIIEDNGNYSPTLTNDSKTVVEGTLNASNQSVSGTTPMVNDNNVTVVNTHLTGSLQLSKAEGAHWRENGISADTPFTFHVKLTPESGVDLTSYITQAAINTVKKSGSTHTYTSGNIEFDVVVTKGTSPVSLTGISIPAGTTYTVTEDTTGLTLDGAPVISGSTGTITTTTSSVTITNNYPEVLDPISLDILKVNSANNSIKLPGAKFDLYYKPASSTGTAPTQTPVLYATTTNDVSYSWTETSADNMLRLDLPSGWGTSSLTATFSNGGTFVETKNMILDSGTTYKVDVPTSTYDSVVFSDGSKSSSEITLDSNNNFGKNYKVEMQTSTGTYSDGKVRFDNSSLGWSNVYVRFWNSSGSESSTDYLMTTDGSGIYEYTVPTPASFNRVRFLTKSSGTMTQQTLDISVSNGGANQIFTPNINESNIYFRVASNTWSRWSNKIYAYYYNSATDEYKPWGDQCPEFKKDSDKKIHFEIGNVSNAGTYNNLIIFGYDNGTNKWQTITIDVSGTPKNGGGRIYQIWATNSQSNTDWNNLNVVFLGYGSSPDSSGSFSSTGTTTTWNATYYSAGTTNINCTATYQPEDRYDDENNYLYITGVTDPHIKFYTTTDGSGTVIGGTDAGTYGIKLTSTDLISGGTYDGYYKIRLPKDAKSFCVNGGTAYTLSDDAGSKFTVNSSTNAITRDSQRSGIVSSPTLTSATSTTAGDFIYFIDTGGIWSSSGSSVFAYYFGGVNGEYSEWQGVSAVKSYDDNGDKIYVFQYPSSITAYPKVIFNCGTYPSSYLTTAVSYAAGSAYERTVSGTEQYGVDGNNDPMNANTTRIVALFTPDLTAASGTEVKLATVVTGLSGHIARVTHVLDSSDTFVAISSISTNSDINSEYLANTKAELTSNTQPIIIKVQKTGTYIWRETAAPTGYDMPTNTDTQVVVESTDRGNTLNPKLSTITNTLMSVIHSTEVIVTKTAKERVGTTIIGQPLAGAQFQLVKSPNDETLRFIKSLSSFEYTSSLLGTYNNAGRWLTTGADGKLHIKGLAAGEYILIEKAAPGGYKNTDSTGAELRTTFTVTNAHTSSNPLNVNISDEMNPAYIQLYEHINEKKHDNWGDPTFIFKITQQSVASPKEYTVALTVDDTGVWTAGLETGPGSETYHNTTDSTKSWLEESTLESEYNTTYSFIDSNGKIRIEPGTYQITRIPVQRYEFVENTWKLETDNDNVYTGAHRTETEAMTLTVSAGNTAIVHYYDKVAYYDKFTHVDTAVNELHN